MFCLHNWENQAIRVDTLQMPHDEMIANLAFQECTKCHKRRTRLIEMTKREKKRARSFRYISTLNLQWIHGQEFGDTGYRGQIMWVTDTYKSEKSIKNAIERLRNHDAFRKLRYNKSVDKAINDLEILAILAAEKDND